MNALRAGYDEQGEEHRPDSAVHELGHDVPRGVFKDWHVHLLNGST
jgi:hypothetical protein